MAYIPSLSVLCLFLVTVLGMGENALKVVDDIVTLM